MIDDGAVLDVNVAHVVEAQDTAGFDARFSTVTCHVADMDVLEERSHLLLFGGEGRHRVEVAAGRTVYVVALEDDSLVFDVGHHDVADKHLLRLAATSQSALEAQSRIRAAEAVVAHHNATHALHGLTAQHKSTMGVEYGVVLNDDVLTTVGGSISLVATALHAQTVVACINGAVDNQSDIDIREVDGVAVLRVPRTAHGNTVHDDILRIAGMQMEFGRVLDGHTLYEHVLTTLKAHQVVAQLLLCLWCVGNVLIAAEVVPGVPQFAVVSLHTANHILVLVPLHVAHLLALDGAPVVAIAVDDALACDGDVLTFRGTDAGKALAGRLGIDEERLVWRHQYDGVLLQM